MHSCFDATCPHRTRRSHSASISELFRSLMLMPPQAATSEPNASAQTKASRVMVPLHGRTGPILSPRHGRARTTCIRHGLPPRVIHAADVRGERQERAGAHAPAALEGGRAIGVVGAVADRVGERVLVG